MYCANCKMEVDINSVAVSKAKGAYTMFNEDGLGMTRVSGGNDKIVNVCKSCGKSEYLWESVEVMRLAAEKKAEKKRQDSYVGLLKDLGLSGRDIRFFCVAILVLALFIFIVANI